MYSILIIEDDYKLSRLVKENLEKYGYKVTAIEDFKDMERQFEEIKPDLVLLDINIPYYDGFYLCRVFRKKSSAPVIIISARSGAMEQVMGMELGADDYITKPFNKEVLVAKVRASLRRAYGEYAGEKEGILELGGLLLNQGSFKMFFRGQEVELSKNEFGIMRELLENQGRIVKREVLLEKLWDEHAFVDENTLNVNITRVKHKLAELGIKDAVKTKRGVGYSLDPSAFEGIEGD